MKKALIVRGGWDGHEPMQVSEILAKALRENGFEVELSETLDSFRDGEKLKALDLIVPIWTMGSIEREQLEPLLAAVRGGVGIAGGHGGMGDAFRQATEYQLMVGGQWVAHPGGDGIRHMVKITAPDDPIVAGMHDFEVCTEQYLMHVDVANTVLAVTPYAGTDYPVTWTKMYGKGRVFYCSLGHVAQVFDQDPQILEMVTRGMLWASESRALAEA
jgi:type 1 glutamine amidotransferase